jgi:hypothetical protein
MIRAISGIFGITLLLLASTGLAHDSAAPISEGTYITEGASPYLDGSFALEKWATGFNMTSTLLKDGREYATKVFLEPVGPNRYRGSGYITVRYENGTGCRHRFGAIVYVDDDGLYLRENTPKYIPYNPNGACTAAGPYEWFNHEAPYNLVQ